MLTCFYVLAFFSFTDILIKKSLCEKIDRKSAAQKERWVLKIIVIQLFLENIFHFQVLRFVFLTY